MPDTTQPTNSLVEINGIRIHELTNVNSVQNTDLAVVERKIEEGGEEKRITRNVDFSTIKNYVLSDTGSVDIAFNTVSSTTPYNGDNSTKCATTAFVNTAITSAIGGIGDDVVHITGIETISGDKTFTGSVTLSSVLSGVAPVSGSNNTEIPTTSWVKSRISENASGYVTTTGSESISGNKSFTSVLSGVTPPNGTVENSTLITTVEYVNNQINTKLSSGLKGCVDITTTQEISGNKTFTSVLSAATPDLSSNDSSVATTEFVKDMFVCMSESEYEALTDKNPNAFYCLYEDETPTETGGEEGGETPTT